MLIYGLYTKIRLTMLCLSGFELYPRWVPLLVLLYALRDTFSLSVFDKCVVRMTATRARSFTITV